MRPIPGYFHLGSKERALTILKSQPCVQTIAVKEGDIR